MAQGASYPAPLETASSGTQQTLGLAGSLRGGISDGFIMYRIDSLQVIVRDLWAYQIAITPAVSPPWLDPSGLGNQAGLESPGRHEGVRENADEVMGDEGSDGESTNDGSDSGSSREERSDPEVDPELLAMLSEGDGCDKEEGPMREVSPGQEITHWRRRRRLKVSDTIATLALALWVLRWPVSFIQIER